MLKEEIITNLEDFSTREILEAIEILTKTLQDRFEASPSEERSKFIRELVGKYRHVPTSSDAFAARKQQEKGLEERRWRE